MIELALAILLALLILVFLGRFAVIAVLLFGVLLSAVAAALIYVLRAPPDDIALGIVAASVLIGSISREAGDESRIDTRPTKQ
jgi:hypothetical protein